MLQTRRLIARAQSVAQGYVRVTPAGLDALIFRLETAYMRWRDEKLQELIEALEDRGMA